VDEFEAAWPHGHATFTNGSLLRETLLYGQTDPRQDKFRSLYWRFELGHSSEAELKGLRPASNKTLFDIFRLGFFPR
jgi:hypothetical protein